MLRAKTTAEFHLTLAHEKDQDLGWVDARAVDISESSNEFLDLVAKQAGGVSTEL